MDTTLIAALFVFLLATLAGAEVINKVPPTLHTPLMSGSNAISGIAVIGAILVAGEKDSPIGMILGLIAIVLATINVVGGFLVTDRMLQMFKKKSAN
jgi:H+-translocating NAD(P) transhydrogenase subunit alpha